MKYKLFHINIWSEMFLTFISKKSRKRLENFLLDAIFAS